MHSSRLATVSSRPTCTRVVCPAAPRQHLYRLNALPGDLAVPSSAAQSSSLLNEAPTANAEASPLPAPALPNGPDDDGRYTLGHYYGSTKKVKVPELNHDARRRQRVVGEIVEAGRRLGIKEEVIRGNLDKMEALLPELTPDVNKMRAADWAKLAKDINQVAMMLVVIKTSYPGANVGKIVSRAPKILLQSPEQLQADAAVIRKVLAGAPNADSIIEEVPYLMSPPALAQSLSNVSRWYNTKDPVSMISKNPKLLLNVEEADLEADPLYGDAIYVEDDLPELQRRALAAAAAAAAPLAAARAAAAAATIPPDVAAAAAASV